MMLTRRDLDIISFLEDYRIATTSTIAKIFFPTDNACRKRLKTLADNNRVKRARMTMNYDYMYYVKKPSKLPHDLLVTEFYRLLILNSKVIHYKIDKELGDIRPDAIFAFEKDNRQCLGLLEVEISNKGFNYDKYDKFYKSGAYKEFFPIMPTVYVVSNTAKIPRDTPIKFIKMATNMNDFRL